MTGDEDEIHLGGGDVGREFLCVRLVVQLCDSLVGRVDHRDDSQVDLDAQPPRVDVVRFAVVVIVHPVHDGDGIVTVLNNTIVVQLGEAKV